MTSEDWNHNFHNFLNSIVVCTPVEWEMKMLERKNIIKNSYRERKKQNEEKKSFHMKNFSDWTRHRIHHWLDLTYLKTHTQDLLNWTKDTTRNEIENEKRWDFFPSFILPPTDNISWYLISIRIIENSIDERKRIFQCNQLTKLSNERIHGLIGSTPRAFKDSF